FVFVALDVEVVHVAAVNFRLGAHGREFAERHAALALQADIDNHVVIVDPEHRAGNDGTLEAAAGAEGGIEKSSEIIGPGIGRRVRMTEGVRNGSHVAKNVLKHTGTAARWGMRSLDCRQRLEHPGRFAPECPVGDGGVLALPQGKSSKYTVRWL